MICLYAFSGGLLNVTFLFLFFKIHDLSIFLYFSVKLHLVN